MSSREIILTYRDRLFSALPSDDMPTKKRPRIKKFVNSFLIFPSEQNEEYCSTLRN